MKIKELIVKEKVELQKMLAMKQEKLRAVRFRIRQGDEKNVRSERQLKKDIARVFTVLNKKPSLKK
ncbi:MAG: 50S ribosomal protein L29 [Candidatus Kerfeldbacteria bacterium RIFCSPHIGHO2_02_FULL_42_14]|uniref:Large ribosomal subunit protein uL29 n=1 Tax=Candidatus Kerfeldbacteria bacterium RIFCSPHIGHO2_02_FULL_42_14 TaxID=1798540 RepID=A0A1G2AUH2_9BACT|nr:MAG: 50S ribosomal protein L29 [Candidatus Kerfeldbacteria bacterium RIFCSPHIGHO2_02_FULL_42_14]OGY80420.1 MAG: 50S ribosomal protein L29 [Candidatus Kerfeldbacteria bacterium RIFCSPHIGHO2_12_FULL_42_13]OGY83850.1 MAG: 50S ribosomal protein L29 [Candidatus Kerfeldbacteria bacterium RIFCSPLOWO2_02_FULL_42_19]OGY85305.1 MAG: 50S ribosomal protein L29 [Candidatus Kerfeldbacteria bacterium RIFCSPLOWO2_12_FULL_43_9]